MHALPPVCLPKEADTVAATLEAARLRWTETKDPAGLRRALIELLLKLEPSK